MKIVCFIVLMLNGQKMYEDEIYLVRFASLFFFSNDQLKLKILHMLSPRTFIFFYCVFFLLLFLL